MHGGSTMLNPHPRTTSVRRPASHLPTVLPRRDVRTQAIAMDRCEGVRLGVTSRDGTSHAGTHRSRQVPSTLRRVEPSPLRPREVAGSKRPSPAPTSRVGVRSANAPSRRSRDTVTALQWLRDGAPIEDARTVIEVRRRFELSPELARRYAINIVRAAIGMLRAERSNPSREEITHAVA